MRGRVGPFTAGRTKTVGSLLAATNVVQPVMNLLVDDVEQRV